MPLAYKLKFSPGPTHTTAQVFVGEDGQTLALAGVLRFRREEFLVFAGALMAGASVTEARPCVSCDAVPAPPAMPQLAIVKEPSHG